MSKLAQCQISIWCTFNDCNYYLHLLTFTPFLIRVLFCFSLLDSSKCTRVTYNAALYAILTYVWHGHKPVPWRTKNMNMIMAIWYVLGTIQTFAHRSYNTYRGWIPFRLEIVWCWFVVVLVSTSMSSFVHSFQIAYRFLDPVILRVLRVITIHRNVW